MKKYNAIVIGCGRIGAYYDLNNDSLILSHAKGYYLSNYTELTWVVDNDINKAKLIGEKYNCRYTRKLSDIDLTGIDIVSICTPTEAHFECLKYLHDKGYRNKIILEKPPFLNTEESRRALCLEKAFLDNVYINYIRRYDETYHKILCGLKKNNSGSIKNIFVNYFGNFKDNAIHALNITNFIFDTSPECLCKSKNIIVLRYGTAEVIFTKIDTPYLNFTIDILTETKRYTFDNLGYRFQEFDKVPSKKFNEVFELKLNHSKNVLNKYILSLIKKIIKDPVNIPTIYEGIRDMEITEEIEKC